MFLAAQQFAAKPQLFVFAFLFILVAFGFNGFGASVTKYSSATTRSLSEQTRTVVIWFFFLAYPGFGQETFEILKLAGFVLIISGVLFFNEILVFDGC